MAKIGNYLMEGLIQGMSASDIEGFITTKIGSMTGSAGGVLGSSLVTEAMKYLGTPYVWGGTAPGGFDCSGLVQYVYKQLGVDIGRTTYDQVKQGTAVAKKDLQPGDIVFFGDPKSPHHEGMYIGNGNFIQAPATGQDVKVTALNSRSDYAGARRIIQEATAATGSTAEILKQALTLTGTSQSWLAGLQKLVTAESGGSQTDINPISVNGEHATGLLQMLPSTFKDNMVKGHTSITNGLDNAMSAINYIKERYGTVYNTPLFKSGGKYVGYDTGSESIPQTEMAMMGESGPELRLARKGDAILTASVTKNLMELGKYTPKTLMSLGNVRTVPNIVLPKFNMPDITVNVPTSKGKGDMTFKIANIDMSHVSNPEQFINQLVQLSHVSSN